MRFYHLLFYVLISSIVLDVSMALEGDPYLVWEKKDGLKDGVTIVNKYINDGINLTLKQINKLNDENGNENILDTKCEKVAMSIYNHFNYRRTRVLNIIAQDLWNTMTLDKIPNRPYRFFNDNSNTIYGGSILLRSSPLAPTININGIYFSLDKLDHFFSLGVSYYQIYLNQLSKGSDEETALKEAINSGINGERGLLGYRISGVFSYGDLEANFQGLVFGRDLCEGENPFLRVEDNKYILDRPIDMIKYVNPNWDESYNTSHFGRIWGSVAYRLKKYCNYLNDPIVLSNREYYEKFPQSRSNEYLESLIKAGKIGDPEKQSLKTLCKH